ncbi:class I SAM-dependent methyltransferase [Herbaspirillum rhizosphaerae]|uniref:Class I SAM-dependent methyltransferase n=1 Tax=Herbaspirillum rhizosphaerae TaxID=346179 RepID=A0ABW8Z9Y8_9BURK
MNVQGYHESRFQHSTQRDVVWKTLIQAVFQKMSPTGGTVLELGAGYCEFINNITAAKKIAVDLWPQFPSYANKDVQAVVGEVSNLDFVTNTSVDTVFASNLFEHLDQDEFAACLSEIKRKLTANGRLIIMQPNYRYASTEYFDDYTHKAIWSHVSIRDFLDAHGFDVTDLQPRFLPLSMKSRLPSWPILIKTYLKSPFKFMGKQMLVVAQVKKSGAL